MANAIFEFPAETDPASYLTQSPTLDGCNSFKQPLVSAPALHRPILRTPILLTLFLAHATPKQSQTYPTRRPLKSLQMGQIPYPRFYKTVRATIGYRGWSSVRNLVSVAGGTIST